MDRRLIIFIILIMSISITLFGEDAEIDSTVLNADAVQEYFIIKGGEDIGIQIGDGLIVHRKGEKIAEAYIVETRSIVSAAEVLSKVPGKKIQEGDNVLIVKKIPEQRKKEVHRNVWTTLFGSKEHGKKLQIEKSIRKKSRWTPILGTPVAYKANIVSAKKDKIGEIKEGGNEGGLIGYIDSQDKTVTGKIQSYNVEHISSRREGDKIGIVISAPKNTVFFYALAILRENGFSIISSNRSLGTIIAFRPIHLPLRKELWSDIFARIDHKIVLSLEIGARGDSTEVIASSFKEHFQKGRQIRHYITKGSREYDDIIIIISEIKKRSIS